VFNNPLDTLVIGINTLGNDAPLLDAFHVTIEGFQAGDKIAVTSVRERPPV
jgi:hypothetical protein